MTLFANRLTSASREFDNLDTLDLLTMGSLLLLLLNAGHHGFLLAFSLTACVVGLIVGKWRHSSLFWLSIASVLAVVNFSQWYLIDNHKYLMNYWCLAVAMAFLSGQPARLLAANGRVLIGLVFLLATGWKLCSSEFLSGAFFHYQLLLDERFVAVATTIGGLSTAEFFGNAGLAADLANSNGGAVILHDSHRIFWISQAFTWWSLIIEAMLAFVFLVPWRRCTPRVRNGLLWLFAITVYPVVPVIGFGGLLLMMGMAQTPRDDRQAWRIYAALLVALPIYSLLWNGAQMLFR